jgi:hypothetical protein
LSDFVTAAADGGAHTKLIIDYDGTGVSSNSVTIILKNVAYTTDLLTNLINIPAAFVKLEISQLPMSWLKARAL